MLIFHIGGYCPPLSQTGHFWIFFCGAPNKNLVQKKITPQNFLGWAENLRSLRETFQVFRSQAHSDEKSVRWAQAELDKWREGVATNGLGVGGWQAVRTNYQLMFGIY